MKQSEEKQQPPPRILVLRGGAIGDFVVTLPVLQWLRLAAPTAIIDLACHGRVAPLAGGLVTQRRDIESVAFLPLFHDEPARGGAVERFLVNYDLIVSFLGSETVVAERLREIAGERAISIDPIPPGTDQHVTAHFFEQMRARGLPTPDAAEVAYLLPVINVEQAKRDEARTLLADAGLEPGQAVIAVHPGSGSPTKNASVEVLAEVVGWLDGVFDAATPVLIQGEADEAAVSGLLDRLDRVPSVLAPSDLGLLAAVLGECELVIGHDSGVSHIAAAVGTPTVAIFVSTEPGVWAPRGPSVFIAEADAASIQRQVLSHAACEQ